MTNVHASVFDVVANDHDLRVSDGREASVRANLRAREGFGRWLGAARTPDEFDARLELASDGLRNVVADVAGRFASVDAEALYHEVVAGLTPELVKEAVRRPHLCPYHRDMVDISLAEGSPSAGYQSVAPLLNTDKHCEGEGYEGGRCKFRAEMTTQSYWEERQQKLDERRELRQQVQETPFAGEVESPLDVVDVEAPVDPNEVVEPEGISAELSEAPSAVGFGADDAEPIAMAASAQTPFLASDAMFYSFVKEAPGSQHLPGASPKRNRQYEHVKEDCLKRGKSEDECKELAARTVNKQRSEHGETKGSRTAEDLGGGLPTGPEAIGVGQEQAPRKDAEACLGRLQRLVAQQTDPQRIQEITQAIQRLEAGISGGQFQAAFRVAEALETVDVQKGRADGPSPKMDTTRWTPDNPGDVVETEGEGSPHPTLRQDVAETPTYTDVWDNRNDGRLDQTKAVTKDEDVTRKNEVMPETDNNFPGSRDLSAVSSEQDDGNPLRAYLDSLPTSAQLDQAISQYEE